MFFHVDSLRSYPEINRFIILKFVYTIFNLYLIILISFYDNIIYSYGINWPLWVGQDEEEMKQILMGNCKRAGRVEAEWYRYLPRYRLTIAVGLGDLNNIGSPLVLSAGSTIGILLVFRHPSSGFFFYMSYLNQQS